MTRGDSESAVGGIKATGRPDRDSWQRSVVSLYPSQNSGAKTTDLNSEVSSRQIIDPNQCFGHREPVREFGAGLELYLGYTTLPLSQPVPASTVVPVPNASAICWQPVFTRRMGCGHRGVAALQRTNSASGGTGGRRCAWGWPHPRSLPQRCAGALHKGVVYAEDLAVQRCAQIDGRPCPSATKRTIALSPPSSDAWQTQRQQALPAANRR